MALVCVAEADTHMLTVVAYDSTNKVLLHNLLPKAVSPAFILIKYLTVLSQNELCFCLITLNIWKLCEGFMTVTSLIL